MSYISTFAVTALGTPAMVLARYSEDMREDGGSDAWLFSYALMAFMTFSYIKDQKKKGNDAAGKAISVVCLLALLAYFFPIVHGVLILGIALFFAYGMLK